MMNKTILITVFSSLLLSQVSFAACEFFPDMEKQILNTNPNRINCIKEAKFILPKPVKKTTEEIISGPKVDESEIKADSTIHCRYFYRYQNGASNKFRCVRTNEKNQMMSEKGDVVPDAVGISNMTVDGKLEEDVMLKADKSVITYVSKKGETKPMIADVLKVRFKSSIEGLKTMSELTEWRHREAYTSSAASRLAWMMGFPSENYYPVKEVVCFGCDTDPWKDGLNPQKTVANKTNICPGASIERNFNGKRIMKAYTSNPALGKTFANAPWRWDEYINGLYNSISQKTEKPILTEQQKHELQMLVLFINLVHTVEERGSQHVMLCEDKDVTKDQNGKKVCLAPIAGTHDLGSAFGNRDSKFVKKGNHPRGDFMSYKALNMFLDNKCTLAAQPGRGPEKNLKPLTTVSEAARKEFVERLDLVSREDLMAVLKVSHFEDMDMIFKRGVAKEFNLKDDALNQKVLQLWTDLIYSKMDQFRKAQCANQSPI